MPNVTQGCSSAHRVVGMSGATVFHGQMHEYHHQVVRRYIQSVQRWAAGAVPLNSSDLTGFHEVNAR